jgi:hypothetical protein
LDDLTSDSPSFTSPNVSADTKLVFDLIVKDNKGAKGYSIVTIIDKPITTPLVPSSSISSSNVTQQQPSQPLKQHVICHVTCYFNDGPAIGGYGIGSDMR